MPDQQGWVSADQIKPVAPPAGGDWVSADDIKPVAAPKSLLEKGWDWLSTPPAFIQRLDAAAQKIADEQNAGITIQTPTGDFAKSLLKAIANNDWAPLLQTSQGKAFFAGANASAAHMAASLTSPAGAGLAVASAGESVADASGAVAAARVLRAIQAAGGAGFAASGAQPMADAIKTGNINEGVQALATIVGGAAGATHGIGGELAARSAEIAPTAAPEAVPKPIGRVAQPPPVVRPLAGVTGLPGRGQPLLRDVGEPATEPATEGVWTPASELQAAPAAVAAPPTELQARSADLAAPEQLAATPKDLAAPAELGGAGVPVPALTPTPEAVFPAATPALAPENLPVPPVSPAPAEPAPTTVAPETTGATPEPVKTKRVAPTPIPDRPPAGTPMLDRGIPIKRILPAFDALPEQEQSMLGLMRDELAEFPFQKASGPEEMEDILKTRGNLVGDQTGLVKRQGGTNDNLIKNTAGTPILFDIRQEKGWTRPDIRKALDNYIGGGKPSVMVQYALDAARHRLGTLEPQMIGEPGAGFRNRPGKMLMETAPGSPFAAKPPALETPAEEPETSQPPKRSEAPPLPANLERASPRFGYGQKNFELSFSDPIDKALYIVANATKRSPRDADYLSYLKGLGLDEKTAREAGDLVKDAIKQQAKDAPAGEKLTIPQIRPDDLQYLHGGLGAIKPELPQGIKDVLKEWKDRVLAAKASPEAQSAADILHQRQADIANAATLEKMRGSAYERFFRRRGAEGPKGDTSPISEYEKTGSFPDEPSPGYSRMYRESTDAAHRTLQKAYGVDPDAIQQNLPGTDRRVVGYWDNYVRRAFTFANDGEAAKAQRLMLGDVKRSLSANKSPIKGRVLDMPLDEALKTMRDAGIKVDPVTTNPETLRQWSLANARQAWAYRQAWDEWKAKGLIRFGEGITGKDVPTGWVPLEDKVATTFFPTDAGMVLRGKYYADPTVARILNRAISVGLGGSPTYRGIRALNNGLNQFQLGLSGFHLTGTMFRSAGSELALGMQKVSRGLKTGSPQTMVEGAGRIARSSTILGSFLHNAVDGYTLTRDLKAGAPEALDFLEKKLNPGGGRILGANQYENASLAKMKASFAQGEYFKGMARAPLAALEATAYPIMHWAVPYAKLGAFMDMAADIQERLGPDATPEQMRRAYRNASDVVDNRFGEMTQENLDWDKFSRDAAQVTMRSIGWNLGTAKDLGGGLADLVRGRGTDQAYYVLAAPIMVAYAGGMYQYLHTGTWPKTIKDYFAPKNGQQDANGNPERNTMPTELKDAYAATHHPLAMLGHKASPLGIASYQGLFNRDAKGDMIVNPADVQAFVGSVVDRMEGGDKKVDWDDVLKVAEQIGKYAVNALQPMSIEQMRQTLSEDDTTGGRSKIGSAAEHFVGVMPAAREAIRTPAMQELDTELNQRIGQRPRTPEEVDTDDLKRQARAEVRTGNASGSSALKTLVQQGYFDTPDGKMDSKKFSEFMDSAKKSPLQRQLELLPLPARIRVLKQLIAEKQAQSGGKQ